eukprot:5961253-Pyramimonas_sp.AAC.1
MTAAPRATAASRAPPRRTFGLQGRLNCLVFGLASLLKPGLALQNLLGAALEPRLGPTRGAALGRD